MKTVKIFIDYAGGAYNFREANAEKHVVEVPETTVTMWRAVLAAQRVMQQQLGALDDACWTPEGEWKAPT